MSGYAGLNPPRNRKPGQSESNGDAKIWKKEKGVPVAGQGVNIVELLF